MCWHREAAVQLSEWEPTRLRGALFMVGTAHGARENIPNDDDSTPKVDLLKSGVDPVPLRME